VLCCKERLQVLYLYLLISNSDSNLSTSTDPQDTILSEHISAVHLGMKNLKCDRCPFATGHSSSHYTHVKKVHFQCDCCNFVTHIARVLKKHVREAHADGDPKNVSVAQVDSVASVHNEEVETMEPVVSCSTNEEGETITSEGWDGIAYKTSEVSEALVHISANAQNEEVDTIVKDYHKEDIAVLESVIPGTNEEGDSEDGDTVVNETSKVIDTIVTVLPVDTNAEAHNENVKTNVSEKTTAVIDTVFEENSAVLPKEEDMKNEKKLTIDTKSKKREKKFVQQFACDDCPFLTHRRTEMSRHGLDVHMKDLGLNRAPQTGKSTMLSKDKGRIHPMLIIVAS
jgi:hypothetical protein